MRAALVLLLTAGLALAAPNGKRQDSDDDTTPDDDPTTTASMELPTVTDTVVLPTMTSVPSFNTSLPIIVPPLNSTVLPQPPNSTTSLPPVITSSASLPSSSSVYSRSSRSRRPHTEPIPIFTSKCACVGFSYPCYAYDALNRCIYEENFSLGCWFQNKGCPSPTRTCTQLFKPTPPTGKRHPCDLSPPEETISMPGTSTELVITASPTLPTPA